MGGKRVPSIRPPPHLFQSPPNPFVTLVTPYPQLLQNLQQLIQNFPPDILENLYQSGWLSIRDTVIRGEDGGVL